MARCSCSAEWSAWCSAEWGARCPAEWGAWCSAEWSAGFSAKWTVTGKVADIEPNFIEARSTDLPAVAVRSGAAISVVERNSTAIWLLAANSMTCGRPRNRHGNTLKLCLSPGPLTSSMKTVLPDEILGRPVDGNECRKFHAKALLHVRCPQLTLLDSHLAMGGGVTRRTAGRGPAVQSLRMVAKIPALMFVSGLPVTWRSTVGACANASAGNASKKQIDDSVGRFIGSTPDAL